VVLRNGVRGCGADQVLQRFGDEAAAIIVNRANAAPGSTTSTGWGAELAEQSFGAFLADLAPYSGASRLFAQAVPARLGANGSALYPVRTGGPVAPAWVSEGGGIPLQSAQFSNITVGPARTMSHSLAWSRELGRRSDAAAIFEKMLREDISAGIDGAFFSAAAGSASAHEGGRPAPHFGGIGPRACRHLNGVGKRDRDCNLLRE
jgi:hypothetical protein